MSARTLNNKSSLSIILTELRYTLSQAQAQPLGAPFVPGLQALRDDWTPLNNHEIALTEKLSDAQAQVDVALPPQTGTIAPGAFDLDGAKNAIQSCATRGELEAVKAQLRKAPKAALPELPGEQPQGPSDPPEHRAAAAPQNAPIRPALKPRTPAGPRWNAPGW